MTKPIPDKAEIALEYPDKLYVGTFERSARFEAHLDPTGIALTLERPGAEDVRKAIHMHINFGLFADILRELASTVGRIPKDDILHHDQLIGTCCLARPRVMHNCFAKGAVSGLRNYVAHPSEQPP
jgi:hypothetical protein